MLVASQCFGTGAAAALVFPLVALLLRPATLSSPLPRAILAAVPVIVVLAWLAAMRVLVRDPAGIQTAKMFAGLAADVRHVGLVALHLAGIGLVDLLLGLPFPAASYGNALSLATSALFGLAVSVILVRGRAWMRRVLLALLLLVATSYLVVSAVRASLYVAASKGNLLSVLVQGTRHHYLSQSVLAVAVALVLAELGCLLRPAVWTRAGLVGAWTGWALATPLLFNPHVGRLEDPRVARVRAQLEQAIRNEPVGTTVCLPVEPVFLTLDFPGTLGVFALYHPGDEFEGRRVRFMSSDPKLLALRGTSERMRRLLLPDGACPGVDGEPD